MVIAMMIVSLLLFVYEFEVAEMVGLLQRDVAVVLFSLLFLVPAAAAAETMVQWISFLYSN